MEARKIDTKVTFKGVPIVNNEWKCKHCGDWFNIVEWFIYARKEETIYKCPGCYKTTVTR